MVTTISPETANFPEKSKNGLKSRITVSNAATLNPLSPTACVISLRSFLSQSSMAFKPSRPQRAKPSGPSLQGLEGHSGTQDPETLGPSWPSLQGFQGHSGTSVLRATRKAFRKP